MSSRKSSGSWHSANLSYDRRLIRSSGQFKNHFTSEDLLNKIKNSICFILQNCERFELANSTKYIALSLFIRCLTPHFYFNDEKMSLLKLCSLKLAAKSFEASPKSLAFDSVQFIQSMGIQRSPSDILQFEFELFCELNFNIYLKSPYEFADELAKSRNLPQKYFNAINSYIDFALTLIELMGFTGEEIFGGCLVALKKSKKMQNKLIIGLIQETCGRIDKAYQIGDIIIQNYQSLLESQQL